MPPALPPIVNQQSEDDWGSGVGFRILIVFLVVAVLGGLAAWKSGMLNQQPLKTFRSEDNLRAAVVGESPDSVIELLGRPDATFGDAWKDDGAEWVYFGRVYNRATDSHDIKAVVTFHRGRAK